MEDDMLYWALVFFIIAIIAAFFGFGGIATTAQHRAGSLLCFPGYLRDRSCNGSGRSASSAYLTPLRG